MLFNLKWVIFSIRLFIRCHISHLSLNCDAPVLHLSGHQV